MTVSSRLFTPGALLEPIAGTIRWEGDKAVGTWGDEANPIRLYIWERDGSIRQLNRAERRLAARIYPARGR